MIVLFKIVSAFLVFENFDNSNYLLLGVFLVMIFVFYFVIDLVKDIYKAGRQTSDIDFQFTKQCFSTKVMNHVSKIHFIITREKLETIGYAVFITDTSSNGTFLNGEKIGKDCRWVLSNNDKIGIISGTNNGKLFYFFIINL